MVFSCPFCHERVPHRGAEVCGACHRRMVHRCPACAEDVSVLATVCKYCGESVTPAPEQEPVTPAVAPAPVAAPAPEPAATEGVEILEGAERPEIEFVEEPAAKPAAWEDASRGGRLRRWWSTWSTSQFSPSRFWESMAPGTQRSAISYSWFMTFQALILFGLPLMAIFGVTAAAHDEPVATYAVGGLAYLALFPLTFAATALGTWLCAGLWHLPLWLLGAKGGFGTTVRAVGYNSGTKLWGLLLPYVGIPVGMVFNVVLNYYAFRHAHRMSAGRALVGALLPAAAAVVLVAAAVAIIVMCGSEGCGPAR